MIREQILGTFTSTPKKLSNGSLSAIDKKAVGLLSLYKERIEGDQVYNLKHHGGQMRVVHHFSEKSYLHLKKCFPEISNKFVGGSFGENIYTKNLVYKDLCVGDIFEVGTAKLQLTVCRRPCATINHTYEDARILKEVIKSAHAGWFYRVLQEGEIRIGDELILIERLYPRLSLETLFAQGYGPKPFSDKQFLNECLDTGLMDKGWQPKIKKLF